MAKLVWDAVGEKFYETGTKKGVLYPQVGTAYPRGYAWNGLTAVTESPEGAEANDIYADDIKYLVLRSAENFKATIEAYTYPDEFAECDGSAQIAAGVKITQQPRKAFGFSYVTTLGNDTALDSYGEIIHLIWGASAAPSEKAYQTINDSPEAITFSWELSTVPVEAGDYKPTSHMEINTVKADPTALATLKGYLYGTENSNPYLPLPNDIITLFGGSATTYTYTEVTPVGSENPSTEGWYVRSGNDFILSTDTSVIGGTVYYERTANT